MLVLACEKRKGCVDARRSSVRRGGENADVGHGGLELLCRDLFYRVRRRIGIFIPQLWIAKVQQCGTPRGHKRMFLAPVNLASFLPFLHVVMSRHVSSFTSPPQNISTRQPGGVCSYMPNMSLAPCHLELRDIDGPAR